MVMYPLFEIYFLRFRHRRIHFYIFYLVPHRGVAIRIVLLRMNLKMAGE